VKSIKSAWSRASLQLKIFAYSVALVLGLAGSVLFFSYQRASRLAQDSLDQALDSTRNLYQTFERERLIRLELVNSVVAESPIFKAVVSEGDPATVLDSARDMLQQAGSDFLMITEADGTLLARTDRPGRTGEDLSGVPLVRLALEGQRATGIWHEGEKLYHVVAVPLTVSGSFLGSVASGYQIGDNLANEIKKFTRCEVVFFAGQRGAELQLAGSTLAESASAFRQWMVGQDMENLVAARPVLSGETYQSILSPLKAVSGETVGYFVALRSRDRELASFRAFQESVLLVGALMFLVAVGASLLVSRGITRPIKKLVAVTDKLREGDYGSEVEVSTEDEIGSLARSFRALVAELREKSLMEKYISKSAAEMIQKTESFRLRGSARRRVTVLFSDLRGFTALRADAAPEGVLASLNRALSREAELVERYGGQVDKFVADRMMAVFEGSEMSWSAVRCANAIQQNLAEEAEGPTSFLASIGISTGEAVFGNVGSESRLDYTLLGTAVHVAGRLCDEAIPGDILLSQETYEEVKERVVASPLPAMRVYGIGEPVPVYLLSGGAIRPRTQAVGAEETAAGVQPTARMGTGTLRLPTQATAPTVPAAAAPPVLKPGYVLGGRYEIERELGKGGMGMVFQAHDRELDEPVAIKVLRMEIVEMDSSILARFKDEIRLARRITHRNVVRTYDFGDLEGVKFISMEYVQGVTLKQLIKKKGALPLGIGLRIARQTCSALAAAHEQGVVHRDVKPQNIMLTPTSEVKIMDFGIARPVDRRGVTATGLSIGTPDYMSPEQAQGKQNLDHRSDIYSAGVVFFEMFTGSLPFTGETAISIAMKHVQEAPPSPRKIKPDLPPALEALLLKALHKDPTRRHQKITDVLAELQKLSS
jgi:serine/threonine-protein kinase